MAAASTFPLLALFLGEKGKELFLTLLLAAAFIFVLAEVTRLLVRPINRLFQRVFRSLLRQSEESRVTGATYVLLGALGAFALFPRDVAILAVLFTALGDPVAAMVGIRSHGRRFYGKSPWGTLAMALVGVGVAAALHLTGAIGLTWQAGVGAIVAAVTELVPLPLDDNLRVPLVAGGAMALLGL